VIIYLVTYIIIDCELIFGLTESCGGTFHCLSFKE
jgi:hypothetical protein